MGNDVLQDVLQGQDPALSPVSQTTPPAPLLPAGVPILPAPAANIDLTNTSAPDLGSATLGAQLAAKQSPFLRALTEGADAASTAQQKAGTASQPGAWARSIISGTQQALSGVTSALGDAAAVGELPKHTNALGGVLTGIARTEAARTQRLSAEENQKLETTKANLNQRIQEANLNQLNDEIQSKHIALDQQALAVLRTSELPMETVGHDVNHDDITAMLNAKPGDPNKINTGEYTAFRSGTGEHGDVNAYDLSSPEAAAKADKIAKTADLIQTWTGKDFHGSELTGSEFNKYYTMAKGAQVADDARKEQLAEQGLKAAEIDDKLSWTHISPLWNQALAGHEHDPVDALNTLETQHPDLIKQYPNLPELVRKNYGPVQWEDRLKENQKAVEKSKDAIHEIFINDFSSVKTPTEIVGVRAGAQARVDANPSDSEAQNALKVTKNMLDNIRGDAAETEKQKELAKNEANQAATGPAVLTDDLKKQIAALPPDKQAVLNAAPKNQQAALMGLAFGQGDIDLATFPKAVRPGSSQLTESEAEGIAPQLNADWTPQAYKVKQGMYKSATTGDLAKQAQSLNNFIGHADEASTIANQFYNSDPKIFKTVLNAVDKATWGTQVTALQEAINVVNGEFQNMILAGHVPSSDEKTAQATLINANSTVGQINAALKVMGHMGGIRANTINEGYRTATGANFPNLIYRDNVNAAKALGIDTSKYNTGGVVAGGASRTGSPQTQTPKPHAPDLQRPARFPTATGTKQASDGKMYWFDIQGKPLGQLTPEEAAIATKE
jgi:hypothetical protein